MYDQSITTDYGHYTSGFWNYTEVSHLYLGLGINSYSISTAWLLLRQYFCLVCHSIVNNVNGLPQDMTGTRKAEDRECRD